MKKSIVLLPILAFSLLCSCGGPNSSENLYSSSISSSSISYSAFDPDTAAWTPDGRVSEGGLDYQLWESSGHYAAEVIGCSGIDDYDIAVPETVNDKYTVWQIGERAFDGARIRTIKLPTTVNYVKEYAFNKCTSLTSIDLSHVNNIYDDAFWGCESLQSVILSNYLNAVPRYCFASCHNLRKISIPSSVKRIGEQAFGSCFSLSNVWLGGGLEIIGDGAFYYCSSLNDVVIPSAVKEFGASAFAACSSLTSITIPSSVNTIGESCFGFDEALASVYIPSTVRKMGKNLFGGKISPTSAYCQASEIPYNWDPDWAGNVNGGKVTVYWGSTESRYTSAQTIYSYPWKGHTFSNGDSALMQFYVSFEQKDWRYTMGYAGYKVESHLYGYDPKEKAVLTKTSLGGSDEIKLLYNSNLRTFTVSAGSLDQMNGIVLSFVR